MVDCQCQRVYILESDDGCKIGRSKEVAARIKQLEGGSPTPYARVWESEPCENASAIEAILHKRFDKHWLKGEWYDISFDEAVTAAKGMKYDPCTSKEHPINADGLIAWLHPEIGEAFSTIAELNRIGIRAYEDKGKIYFESDELGCMIPEFFFALIEAANRSTVN